MSAAATHYVSRILLDTVGVETVVLGQMDRVGISHNWQSLRYGHGGKVFPTQAVVLGAAPAWTYQSTGLKMLLDNIGLSAFLVDSGGGNAGITTWMQQTKAGGTREGTLKHEQHIMADGMGLITSIEAQHGGIATASGVFLGTSGDGTTHPIDTTADQTIDSTAFTENEFSMGKIVLDGTDIVGLLSHNFDFGHSPGQIKSDNDIFPTHTWLESTAPTLTAQIIDVDAFRATHGIGGRITDLLWYYRHLSTGGDYVATGTATHIKMTAYDGEWNLVEHGAGHLDAESATVVFNIIDDGTNDLTVATTSTIA